MPTLLLDQFAEYEDEYAKIKRGRKLAWMDHLGTIELDVELEDRTVSIEATPLQAAVLFAFQERGLPCCVSGLTIRKDDCWGGCGGS
jgi:anaphase-promoting complex subunit 2